MIVVTFCHTYDTSVLNFSLTPRSSLVGVLGEYLKNSRYKYYYYHNVNKNPIIRCSAFFNWTLSSVLLNSEAFHGFDCIFFFFGHKVTAIFNFGKNRIHILFLWQYTLLLLIYLFRKIIM